MKFTTYEFPKEVRERLRPLFPLNNWRAVLGVCADYFVIGCAIAGAQFSHWLYPVALVLIGSRQRALASLLHEACHKTLARNRMLNNGIGLWLAGVPIFQSFDAYVKSHVVMHHLHLGESGLDPDYINYEENGLFKVRDRLHFVIKFYLKTVLLFNVLKYLKYLLKNRLGAITKSKRELAALFLMQIAIFSILFITTGPFGYLMYWLVPFLTTFQIIGWFSEISEHYPMIKTATINLEVTRNRFPSFAERCFIGMHGDNYHLVHHLFAGIPFWNLRRAHQILLSDPAYAAANHAKGGLFAAGQGRKCVLHQILAAIYHVPPYSMTTPLAIEDVRH